MKIPKMDFGFDFLVFIIGITLIVLMIFFPDGEWPVPSSINDKQMEVTWIEINEPPTYNGPGPCYAYFSKRGEAQGSGVWCK